MQWNKKWINQSKVISTIGKKSQSMCLTDTLSVSCFGVIKSKGYSDTS